MTSSITNILRSLYKIGFPSRSDEEVLDECYKKSRKAAYSCAKATYYQEDLFCKALSDAQETEFSFFKEKEEIKIENTYTYTGKFLANIGSVFIEKEKPKQPELEYQFERLWMVLNSSRSDKQIRDFDTMDNISALIEIFDRDIVKNEASRLYKFYKKNYNLKDPYTLVNYALEEDEKKEKERYLEVKKFPNLWSPSAKLAKKQAKIQLGKDIETGLIVSIGALTITAIVANYAVKYFTKKP